MPKECTRWTYSTRKWNIDSNPSKFCFLIWFNSNWSQLSHFYRVYELLLSNCYHEMLSKLPLSHYFASRLFGTNSILRVEFTASAMRFSNAKLGFLVPFSSLLISAWLIPVFSDNSACVSPASFLARIKDIVISRSGWSASYSFLNAASCMSSLVNSCKIPSCRKLVIQLHLSAEAIPYNRQVT